MAIIKINNNAIDLNAAEIPNLDAAKITTGQFADSKIADVASSKITGTITPSDATVTVAKLASDVTQGITEADQWRLTSNLSGSGGVLTSNLERVDTPADPHLGTGMSESSGIFSFPSTGIYLIQAQGYFNANADLGYVGINMEVTTDNSSYSSQSQGQNWISSGTTRYINTYVSLLLKVSNTTNTKIRFNVNSAGTVTTSGSTNVTYTGFTFLRLGDI